jgi:hypothetical protein
VLANGDITCSSCDVNGQRVYGNVYTDRMGDVFNGPAYQRIRDFMLRSHPDTWCPSIRAHCPTRIERDGFFSISSGSKYIELAGDAPSRPSRSPAPRASASANSEPRCAPSRQAFLRGTRREQVADELVHRFRRP